MADDFNDPTPEEQHILVIDMSTLHHAELLILYCEHCNPEVSQVPFEWILDHLTFSGPRLRHYILETPAKCPNCRHEILEKTLVEPA